MSGDRPARPGSRGRFTLAAGALALALLAAAPESARGNAVIVIINMDDPGEGFNDLTPAAPVGGNPGTTIGEQRLVAFQHAATLWGETLDSGVEIRIQASFDPLACTATQAVLGSAGAIQVFSDFPGAEYTGTWYSAALANKRAGADLVEGDPGTNADDIRARFNVNLGNPGCFTGAGWYYGLDNQHGQQTDLVSVLLHELAHGLGFQNFIDELSGAELLGQTDVYARHTLDLTTNQSWDQMTDAERAASAVNARNVVWSGPQVTETAPAVLAPGTPLLRVKSPPAVARRYSVGPASFGPQLNASGVTSLLVQALDPSDADGPSTTDGCSPLLNAAEVAGKVALIDRGGCFFTTKVRNAQDAGAVAVVIADNAPGAPPPGLGGNDPSIVIPAARITRADANALKPKLPEGVLVSLGVDAAVLAGADPAGRVLLHAPSPLQPGSSISHWDPLASPNQLMEPIVSSDLSHSVSAPKDLTLALLRDIGWFPDQDVDLVPDDVDCEPLSDLRPTVVIQGCDSGAPNHLFATGCTLADLIHHLAASADSRGTFVNQVANLTNQLKANGLLTGAQKGALQACAARATIPVR